MDEPTFRRAGGANLPALIGLFAAGLGDGYVSEADLRHIAEHGVCYLACRGETILGAATAYTASGLSEVLPIGQEHLAGELQLSAPVAVMKSVVVSPDARRQGIGSALIARTADWMRRSGPHSAFSAAWINRAGRAESKHALISAGFAEMMTVPGFWTEDSIVLGYQCPSCGHPCMCGAVLMCQSLNT